jgi:two-component system sensor histidine kinase ChiS
MEGLHLMTDFDGIQELRAENERLQQECDRLRASYQEAVAADEAKSRFLAVISHELKTPLNAIAGFAGLLSRAPEVESSPKLGKYVRNVLAGSEHMRTIVSDLLDLDKIEKGQISLELAEVEPVSLGEEVIQLLGGIAADKNIELALEVDSPPPLVQVDKSRVIQILLNLVGNSIKFTTTGDRVVVSVRSGEGDAVRFVVTDHGPGLSEDDRKAVFRKYVQTGSAEQRRKGNGLGLPLSLELARLHGGKLWAESEGEGCGCSFICEMPIIQGKGEFRGAAA